MMKQSMFSISKRILIFVVFFLMVCCFQDHLKIEAHGYGIQKKYRAEVASEVLVNLSAEKIWAVYGSKELARIAVLLKFEPIESIIFLEGNGGEGSIILITKKAGLPAPHTMTYTESTIDHKKLTVVLTAVKGGYLDLGFTSFAIKYHIAPLSHSSCSIKMTIAFDIKKGYEMKIPDFTPEWNMADAIINYVANNYTIV